MSSRKWIRAISGFSLVELLVVVAIILLLAALAMPRLLDAQKAAYEAGVVSLLRTLQSDQESYRLANGSYADNFTDLGLVGKGPAEPENLLDPANGVQLAAVLPELGAFRVYAAPAQEPPTKTPPSDQGQFGGDPKKRPGKQPATPGAPGVGGSGGTGGGSGGRGGATGGGPGKRGGRRGGGGGGSNLGGGGQSGGTGGGQSGGGAASGGTGGGGAPLGGPSGGATKTNVLVKHNYIFTLLRPTPTTWTCTAAPVRDRINSKFFFMDQTGVMRVESGLAAGPNSPQMDSKTR